MRSSSKSKYKESSAASTSRPSKRRHASPPSDTYEPPREKRHKHKHKHHKERRRERGREEDGDLVEVISSDEQDNGVEGPSSGQGSESISIDETNKLRAKLGLKPLEVDGGAASSSSRNDGKFKDDLGEFYHKPAENWAEKAEREKIRHKLAEHKEKRQLHSKLAKVKTLGESDSEDDVSNWVNKNRKIEKAKIEAQKRAKMLEELDEQFGIGEVIEQEQRERRNRKYTEKDLKGLRIDHDVDTFAEEKQVILTLKDKAVLDNEDDVLVNVNMLDNEKYKKNVENKKKKILYNAYEDREYDEFGNPKEKTLLSKYDEEIDGAKRDGFRIGVDSVTSERKQLSLVETVKEKLARKKLESIAEKQLTLASEYYNEEELARFKKPKKKTRRIRTKGKLTAEDLLPSQKVEQIGSRRNKIKVDGDEPEISIDDVPDVTVNDIKLEDDEKDDLLEKALHKARRIKQKQSIVADILKTEVKEEPTEETDGGNIVLNSTAEFCRTLGDIPTYGKAGNRDEDEDLLDYEKDTRNDEKSDDDCEIVEPSGWNTIDPRAERADMSKLVPQEVQILDEEPDVSTGVGAALKLAMSKGYLDKEQNNRPSNSRLAHLQAQHYSIEDKSYGEEGGNERGPRGGARERYSGPIQEFKEKDSFKPNVKLEYIDDDGHVLNSKEAFRYLSHKFHGKGPGKNKVEKRIKKSVQEQLMKKMSSTDTPLGTLNMLQAKQKETQSAFVVLSGSKQQQQTTATISKSRR